MRWRWALLPVLLAMQACTSSPTVLDDPEPEEKAPRHAQRCLCPPLIYEPMAVMEPLPVFSLSPGDRLRIQVHNGELFSGVFEIDRDGQLYIPHLPGLRAQGLTVPELEQALRRALLDARLLREDLLRVSVRPLQWAGAEVNVSGAVFYPGLVTVNGVDPELQTQAPVQVTGQTAGGRLLSQALSNAGGVLPNADVQWVQLTRDGQSWWLDLTGLLLGRPSNDVFLIAGDAVFVPRQDCLQAELMLPTRMTLPGMRVYLSNLTVPSTSNAQSAVNNKSSELPYGTRLLQGAMSANCVGGTQRTNARRRILHVTKDLETQQPYVKEHALAELLNQSDDVFINSYLMPGDGIACYDSGVTNIRDIARSFTDILTPFTLLRLLTEGSND